MPARPRHLALLLLLSQHAGQLPAFPALYVGLNSCPPHHHLTGPLRGVGVGVQNPLIAEHAISAGAKLKAAVTVQQ